MRLSYENRVVLILALVGGISAIDIVAFNFLSPFIVSDLHLNSGRIGVVVAASQFTWAVGAICTALWSDRIGRRRVFLVGALVGFALLSSATAFATSFLTLLAARSLLGLIEGPVVPIQNAIMHAESTPSRRGVNMGIAQNFGAQLMGGVVAPLLLVGIAARSGWRDAFLVAGAPALAMAAAVRWCLREPPPPTVAPHVERLWHSVRMLAGVPNIRLCLLVGACATGWFATMTAFLPLWLVGRMHLSAAAMSLAMACLGPSGAVSSILVPGLSDRFGRRPLVVIFALVGMLLPLAMLLGPATLPAVAAAVFVGCLFTGIFPLFLGIVPMESVDVRHGATALAIVLAGAQIVGSLIGPLLGGVMADRFSLAAPFWLAIALALGAALAGQFLRETAPTEALGRV